MTPSHRPLFRIRGALLLLAVVSLPLPAGAGAVLAPYPAPDWSISEWINEDPGSLKQHHGKVLLIEFFQLWCPGCNRFSIPLMKHWNEKYGSRSDVLVVSIHTVFEGHDYQTPERLRQFVLEQGIVHPVGNDAHSRRGAEVPDTMARFETEGTPQIVIVDKEGMVVFSHFGSFDPEVVEAFIDRLLKEPRTLPGRSR